jgi:hypothetical protein
MSLQIERADNFVRGEAMKKILIFCILFCCVVNGMSCTREKRYQREDIYALGDVSRADALAEAIQYGQRIQEIVKDVTALNLLIKYQKEDSVRKLFKEYGVKPTFESFAQAIAVGNLSIATQCLDQNPDLLYQENRTGSALHIASLANRTTLAQKFIQMGLDVNRCNVYHDTPLHIAAKCGFRDMVALLCDAGANPFIQNVRSHGRSFDAMDVAYRNMMKMHRSQESPYSYSCNTDVYRTILHLMYRYVSRFGGAIL